MYPDVNLVYMLVLLFMLSTKMVRCSSLPLSPAPVPSLLPHVMLETEARRAEFISPSTAHLSSSLGMKE